MPFAALGYDSMTGTPDRSAFDFRKLDTTEGLKSAPDCSGKVEWTTLLLGKRRAKNLPRFVLHGPPVSGSAKTQFALQRIIEIADRNACHRSSTQLGLAHRRRIAGGEAFLQSFIELGIQMGGVRRTTRQP